MGCNMQGVREDDMARNRDDHPKCIEKAMKQDDEVGCCFDGDLGVEAGCGRIKVQGSRRKTIQVAQQLAWMMTVFRTKKDRNSEERHYAHFEINDRDSNHFTVSPLPLQELPVVVPRAGCRFCTVWSLPKNSRFLQGRMKWEPNCLSVYSHSI